MRKEKECVAAATRKVVEMFMKFNGGLIRLLLLYRMYACVGMYEVG